VFLAFAFVAANNDRKKGNRKGLLMFFAASALSLALMVYSEFFK